LADVGRKPIRLTRHAADAVAERGLAPEWIEAATHDPDWHVPDPHRPGVERRFKAIAEFDNRVLRIACFETEDEIRILTAFFDRKARSRE